VSAGGETASKVQIISSFRQKPESRGFLNYLIFQNKTLAPGFYRGDGSLDFYYKVGNSILFQHPAWLFRVQG
jgi:hypothetical protein